VDCRSTPRLLFDRGHKQGIIGPGYNQEIRSARIWAA
jgi:hypothetical protein